MNRPPQMNRPTTPGARPSQPIGGNRPGLIPQQRPGGGAGNRPGIGNLPGISQRPASPGGFGGSRPGLIPQNRPGNLGGIAGNRPGTPSTLPARPGDGLIGGNRPNVPGGPTQLPARPGIGDGGLANRPNLPGGGAGTLPIRPGGDRPGLPNRPGGSGGEQWRPGDNRPGWANRPGAGGGGEQWPNRPDRPGWRPGDNDRPNWRPGDNNGSNWWANRPINNRPGNNFNQLNQYNNNSNYVTGYGGYGGGYNSQPWYGDWYQSNYSNWGAPLAAWTTTAAASWLADGSSFVYSNPYYTVPATTVVQPVYNYAEPIPVPVPVDQTDATVNSVESAPQAVFADTGAAPTVIAPSTAQPPATDPKVTAAGDAFASARDAFKSGDYSRAQAEVERAIESVPDDPVLHEFRALTLFAQAKYRDSAATLYAVLARGPGWDWDTMRSLYPDVDTYTRQLRALERYIREHPSDGAPRFVLAYHYLVAHQTDAAVRQLKEVVRLAPDNTLAADMVKALTAQPAANAPPQPGQ
jgi:hypothetical protein